MNLCPVVLMSLDTGEYCGMCRYEMVWGLIRALCFTSTTVVLPLIIMSAIYINLWMTIKTRVHCFSVILPSSKLIRRYFT